MSGNLHNCEENLSAEKALTDETALYAERLDDIRHTRDMEKYLDTLILFKNRYLIILSIKDLTGHKMPDAVYNKIHQLGFSKLTKWEGRTYVGVIDKGEVKFDQRGEQINLPTEFQYKNESITLSVKSQAHKWGKSEIIINGRDHSMNCRGWNIVVYDYESEQVIDSSTYDSYVDNPTFYHGHLFYDKKYVESHFYIPEKYKDIWRTVYQKSYFSNEKIGVRELENGIILPNKAVNNRVYGGVCDENFELFAGHLTHQKEPGARVRYISGSYKVDERDIQYIDETVVYSGPMMNHIGHLIVELFLTRMWWYLKNPDKNIKIAVTPYAGSTIENINFIEEFFELFGIGREQLIPIDKPTKFKKVIVPDQCIVTSHVQVPYIYTKEFAEGFEQIRSKIKPSNYKKVFFTKGKTARKNVIGEDYFIDYYKKKGFEIIHPEEHTILEKASFLAGADEFVTMIGTNAHYAIFGKPTAQLTLLTRTDYMPQHSQAVVDEFVGIKNVYFVNVSLGFFHKYDWDGLSFMGVTKEFTKFVKDVYNETLNITPEEYLRRYLYDYFAYIPKYYSNPSNFNYLKNQKMATILQNLSEVFYGEDFDTSHLDLKTNEELLREEVKKLTEQLNEAKLRIEKLETESSEKASQSISETIDKLEKQITDLKALLTGETR